MRRVVEGEDLAEESWYDGARKRALELFNQGSGSQKPLKVGTLAETPRLANRIHTFKERMQATGRW